jgi:chemotaxis protein CheY-P-specific phosphatase CheC
MVNGQKKDLEKKLTAAFEAGFNNAAQALSQMTSGHATFSSFHSGSCRLNDHYLLHDAYKRYNAGARTLLTTDVFGDLTGKSYLFLSARDYEVITRSIPSTKSSINLKEEFLKELDNILSAAVITKLSNDLNKKMFGDIPVMAGETSSQLEDIINDDFMEQVEELYVSSVSFSIGNDVSVQPLFLWVIDYSKVEVGTVKA